MSTRERGASPGALGKDVEFCPYISDAPNPRTHPASRIRWNELKKRECMRISSATFGKSYKSKLTAYGKLSPQKLRGRPRPRTTIFKLAHFTRLECKFFNELPPKICPEYCKLRFLISGNAIAQTTIA